ncbi:MAG: DUF998 domain-containing protein [Acidobacteriota bacterium]
MPTIASRPVPQLSEAVLQRALLACGVLASLVYVAANVVGSLAWPEYRTASQTISELSAIDAPSRATWLAFGIPYELLMLAFAIGVWRAGEGHRALRVAAGLLLASAVIGALWPPMHLRGTPATLTDTLHVVWAGAVSLLILLAVGFASGAGGRAFRIYSIASIAVMLAGGAVTSFLAPGVAANTPTPWIGVWERVDLGAYLLWVAVLAFVLATSRTSTSLSPRMR